MMAMRLVMDGDGYNGVDKNYSNFVPDRRDARILFFTNS
ncbi:MAG: hypothetical protein JWQ24_4437 [Tardiphaga sp.]|nr:hypothetical protein [Tardiphaga sp.]